MNPTILKETSRGIQTISIESAMMKKREIFLTETLSPATASNLLKQLMYLEKTDPGEPVTLYISSPGGEVTSGMAVYDYIQLMKSPVNTVCIGLAASMGAILFLAGQERKMLEHTQIMIHDPSFARCDMGGMKPHEMQKRVNDLRRTSKMLRGVIVDRTGLSCEQVTEITKSDTFFSAKEAVKFGIATEIISRRKEECNEENEESGR